MFLASDIPDNIDLTDYTAMSINIGGVATSVYANKTRLAQFMQSVSDAGIATWSINHQHGSQTDENLIVHVLPTDFFRDLEQTQVCTSEEVELRLQLLRDSGIIITEEEV
jgi:hypothetical protein